ncbi:hypothetical protein RFI_32304 [Reticulomyxa filosa]|uniref:Clathrin heavy chain n=1 Tax=Reticulomyxa filosa TaxID=46433 RepID=X6LUN3_RETFI|nr:hypothetical protein RFI_32304 [Reticulomyxa filosa]|eukprot:ETO05096.1 hypothetical protein RFI_32304 [Reticulomyxa filosa]
MKTTETSESVLYWKWLDGRTIAFVTGTAAYHWSVEGDATPEKKFEIEAETRQVQIINYDSSKDGNWLFLQGIAKNAETQKIEGVLQLYSVQHKRYQPKMNAHGGCFAEVTLSGRESPSTLFCFTRSDGNSTKLFIVEVGGGNPPHKIQAEVPFQNSNDFIVSMVPSAKYRCLYAFTQSGFLFLFDISTGKCLFNRQVSKVKFFCLQNAEKKNKCGFVTTMFLSVADEETGGVLTVDRGGQVALFNVDEKNFVSYITNVLGDSDLGEKFAELGLGGVDVLQQKFETLLRQGNYAGAAEFAAKCPALRNEQTIAAFKKIQPQPNQPPPDLQYYQLLLKQGPLNKLESVELCRRILQFKPDAGKQRIEQFLKENKLEKSEELGDVLAPFDVKLAASIYYGAKIPQKTILCFIQLGQASRVVEYCKQENYTPKWPELLAHVQQMRRDDVKEFAQSLVDQNFLSAADVMTVLLGSGRNDVEKTTEFLLDYLRNRGDREEDAELQTKLLEINLRAAPQVAKAILESEDYKFTHYDKTYIARLCESARLFDCALELYENLDDIKRVLQMGLGSNAFKPDFLLKFFGDLTPEDALSCLKDLLKYSNTGTNLQLVVEVAKRYSEQLTVEKLIQLFEDFEWFVLTLYLFSFFGRYF